MGLMLLHSADWHLDAPLRGMTRLQQEQIRAQQRQLLQRLGEIVRECDMVLLSGDLFHGPAEEETVRQLKDAFADWKKPVFISPGNHDYYGPGSPWEEMWPENVHIFTGPLEAVVLPQLDCRVYGAGYRSMDCPPLLENFRAEGKERHCIGLLHADPVNHNSPYSPLTASQVRDSGLDYLALGHIHKAGSFRAGSTLCAWPGCPMGQGWDESGEKGVFLVTLEERAELQFLPLGFIAFHQETLDIRGDAAAALEGYLPAAGNDNHYRITLTGEGPVDLAALREQFSRFPNLELIDETQPPLDIWADVGEDSLRGAYFRLLQNSQDPNAVLAAELSQKLLLGREVLLP